MTAYATWDDYKTIFLLGREPSISEDDFAFWAAKATAYIDARTFARLRDADMLEFYRGTVIPCVCELAEYYYSTEDNIGKESQSVAGQSVAYRRGGDKEIVRTRLGNTGLLFAGV